MRPFAFTGQRGDVLGSGAEFCEFYFVETGRNNDEAIALQSCFEIFRVGHID
jgi:hypothetical protein